MAKKKTYRTERGKFYLVRILERFDDKKSLEKWLEKVGISEDNTIIRGFEKTPKSETKITI